MFSLVSEWLYHYVLEVNLTVWIVALQCESPVGNDPPGHISGALDIVGLRIVHYYFIIDLDDHSLPLDGKGFCIPFIILYIDFFYVLYGVQAAGPSPIRMGIINLYFITLGRPSALLVFRMKINTGIGSRLRHHFRLEFKILKMMVFYGAFIKKMRGVAMRHNRSILYRKSRRIITHFPAIKRFAIEQGDPSATGCPAGGMTGQEGEANEDGKDFLHIAVFRMKQLM